MPPSLYYSTPEIPHFIHNHTIHKSKFTLVATMYTKTLLERRLRISNNGAAWLVTIVADNSEDNAISQWEVSLVTRVPLSLSRATSQSAIRLPPGVIDGDNYLVRFQTQCLFGGLKPAKTASKHQSSLKKHVETRFFSVNCLDANISNSRHI